MRVHVLLLRDQYDSDCLGVFDDPALGRSAGDQRFAGLPWSPWQPDPRGGEVRKIGVGGAYLWLRPNEVVTRVA
jgi:hypothetical protein